MYKAKNIKHQANPFFQQPVCALPHQSTARTIKKVKMIAPRPLANFHGGRGRLLGSSTCEAGQLGELGLNFLGEEGARQGLHALVFEQEDRRKVPWRSYGCRIRMGECKWADRLSGWREK